METTQSNAGRSSDERPQATPEQNLDGKSHGRNAPTQRLIGALEHRLALGGDAVWRTFKRRPALGISAATLTGLGLATAVGASELAIAFAAGIAAYQILKKNEPPSQALRDAAKFGL